MYASSMASTVALSGTLIVFEMVPERMDRARAARRLEGAVEDRQVLGPERGRPLDGLLLVDVLDDLLDLARLVAHAPERPGHRVVDDLQDPAADQLLVLDERDVG